MKSVSWIFFYALFRSPSPSLSFSVSLFFSPFVQPSNKRRLGKLMYHSSSSTSSTMLVKYFTMALNGQRLNLKCTWKLCDSKINQKSQNSTQNGEHIVCVEPFVQTQRRVNTGSLFQRDFSIRSLQCFELITFNNLMFTRVSRSRCLRKRFCILDRCIVQYGSNGKQNGMRSSGAVCNVESHATGGNQCLKSIQWAKSLAGNPYAIAMHLEMDWFKRFASNYYSWINNCHLSNIRWFSWAN